MPLLPQPHWLPSRYEPSRKQRTEEGVELECLVSGQSFTSLETTDCIKGEAASFVVAGLSLLPLPPWSVGYRCVPPHLADQVFLI